MKLYHNIAFQLRCDMVITFFIGSGTRSMYSNRRVGVFSNSDLEIIPISSIASKGKASTKP